MIQPNLYVVKILSCNQWLGRNLPSSRVFEIFHLRKITTPSEFNITPTPFSAQRATSLPPAPGVAETEKGAFFCAQHLWFTTRESSALFFCAHWRIDGDAGEMERPEHGSESRSTVTGDVTWYHHLRGSFINFYAIHSEGISHWYIITLAKVFHHPLNSHSATNINTYFNKCSQKVDNSANLSDI